METGKLHSIGKADVKTHREKADLTNGICYRQTQCSSLRPVTSTPPFLDARVPDVQQQHSWHNILAPTDRSRQYPSECHVARNRTSRGMFQCEMPGRGGFPQTRPCRNAGAPKVATVETPETPCHTMRRVWIIATRRPGLPNRQCEKMTIRQGSWQALHDEEIGPYRGKAATQWRAIDAVAMRRSIDPRVQDCGPRGSGRLRTLWMDGRRRFRLVKLAVARGCRPAVSFACFLLQFRQTKSSRQLHVIAEGVRRFDYSHFLPDICRLPRMRSSTGKSGEREQTKDDSWDPLPSRIRPARASFGRLLE
ncbi:hypothetical protein BDV95DRAFT_6875 [Massariosphaeria phaeospora]|uniref:Uncharacterized protein n=1 Tax=Massariosphaeria phaeospora TaxID=100035 RepID=A0A7C8IEX1_9PLEO|nr:hypothetical protein BDV95DRAFT_6875 [Massariosphaeria phaeospora]